MSTCPLSHSSVSTPMLGLAIQWPFAPAIPASPYALGSDVSYLTAPTTSSAPPYCCMSMPWEINFPHICVGSYNCVSKPQRSRGHRYIGHCWPLSGSSSSRFSNELSKTCAPHSPCSSAQVQANYSVVASVLVLLAIYTLALLPPLTVILLHPTLVMWPLMSLLLLVLLLSYPSPPPPPRCHATTDEAPMGQHIVLLEFLEAWEYQGVLCKRDWAMTTTATLGWTMSFLVLLYLFTVISILYY